MEEGGERAGGGQHLYRWQRTHVLRDSVELHYETTYSLDDVICGILHALVHVLQLDLLFYTVRASPVQH